MLATAHLDDGVLATLPADFRRAVEASASSILLRIVDATPTRLEGLAALAASEALTAVTEGRARTAFALAAELKRRAQLLRH